MNRVGAITSLIGLPYSLTVVRIVLRRTVSICVCMFLKNIHTCVFVFAHLACHMLETETHYLKETLKVLGKA